MDAKTNKADLRAFLRGGGEMGQLTRQMDWSRSALGEPEEWPQSLKTTLGIIINSKFPMFLWWGPDLICFYNDAYRPSLGDDGKHPSILGMPAEEAWPEIWDFIKPLISKVRASSDAVFFEDHLVPIYRNGKMEDVYWTFSYSPVPDEMGEVAGVLVTCNETTHKVQTLKHLQESERRFQNLIRDASVGVVMLEGDQMKVEMVNEAYGRLIGRELSELIGRPIFEIVPEAAQDFEAIIRSVFVSGEGLYLHEHPYRVIKDGKEFNGFLNLTYQPFREGHEAIRGVIIFCQDVTLQVLAQKNIETALEQIRLSREAAQLGMFDMDLIKDTMEWDSRCRALFGISHSDTVTYDRDFINGLHPEDRERIIGIISDLFDRKNGGDYDVEYRTVGANDGRIRWVRAKGKVYFGNYDRPLRFIGSVLDITDQKINEQRKNDFIAMVSHELKTPLTSLNAYIQFLLREMQGEANTMEYDILERARVQTKRMTGLINGFLNLSRFESGKIELKATRFPLDGLIREIISDLTAGAPGLEIEFLPCLPVEVMADREKIGSVIHNLLSNAVKYSSHGKTVTVQCENREGSVVVSVTDKGIGIRSEDLSHIFDRFYRVDNENTKDISGFGIGLYLSAEIVKIHGGKIWVESNYGAGSTFYFSIPVA